MEISVVPIGTEGTSLSNYVAGCLRELENSRDDIHYELTGMGTIIEGDLEIILALSRRMHEIPFDHGAKRVLTTIKIDDRRDMNASIGQKVQSVRKKL